MTRSKLVALVGVNVGGKRFEADERIDASILTNAQYKYLIEEGYVLPVEAGQRLPADVRAAIQAGAGDPVEVITQVSVDPTEGEG